MSYLIQVFISIAACAVVYIILVRKLDSDRQTKKTIETIQNEIGAILVELNNTTDRNVAIIEARITELQNLIAEGDKHINIYRREIRKPDTYSALARVSPPKRTDSGSAATAAENPSPNVVKKEISSPPARAGEIVRVAAEEKAELHRPNSPVESSTTNKGQNIDDKRQKVLKLAGEGIDARIISQKLHMDIGEVELIISLAEKL